MAQTAAGRMLVGTLSGRVFVRVEGRATHINSQPLREFLEVMAQRGHRDIDLDLGECIFLDSTFVGVLAVMALRLKGAAAGTVRIFRAPERCVEMFQNLGVHRYFTFVPPEEAHQLLGPEELDLLPAGSRTRAAWATTIVEAHRVLSDADPGNVPRLRDLLDSMQERPVEGELREAKGAGERKN